jgi:hypothetical protein
MWFENVRSIERFSEHDDDDEVFNLVYFPHYHAKHHFKIINILNRCHKLTSDEVFLLAPNQVNMTFILRFTREYFTYLYSFLVSI